MSLLLSLWENDSMDSNSHTALLWVLCKDNDTYAHFDNATASFRVNLMSSYLKRLDIQRYTTFIRLPHVKTHF